MAKVGSYGAGPQGANPDDEATPVDKNKFKEQLKKVDAVEKTDPDQKSKKRKPGKEEEDIEQASQAILAAQPPPSGAPSLLGSSGSQAGTPSVSSSESSSSSNAGQSYTPSGQTATPPPPSTDEPVETSASNEADNMTQVPQEIEFDEIDFDTSVPSQIPLPAPSSSAQAPAKPPSSSPNTAESRSKEAEPADLSENKAAKILKSKKSFPFNKNKEQYRQELKTALQKYEHDLKLEPIPEKKQPTLAAPAPVKKISKSETLEKEVTSLSEEQEETKIGPVKSGAKAKTSEKLPEEVLKKAVSKHKGEKQEPDEKIEPASTATMAQAPITIPINEPPPMPAQAASASYLSPQVHELFQTMIGLVMVKQVTSEGGPATEMEVALNNPEYANSKFYGLTIKITEYKSAPGAYNIELVGSSDQTKILEEQKRKLISALNDNRYSLPFTVNRLDVSLKKDDKEFLFKRKESVKGDSKDAGDNQTSP